MEYIAKLLPNAPIIPTINSIVLPPLPDISYPQDFLSNPPTVKLPNITFKLDAIIEETKASTLQYGTYLQGLLSVPQLPASLDLRNNLGPVISQGAIGSCVAHGTACMKEWQEKNSGEYDGYFSTAYIYLNRSNQGQSGMYVSNACDILATKGVCKTTTLPYSVLGTDDTTANALGPSIIPQNANVEANQFRISNSVLVTTVNDLKTALFLNGPCPFGVYIYGDVYGNLTSRPRMWIKDAANPTILGGHCMCFVGYNSNGFIVRNSWGEDWNPLNSTTDMMGYDYLPFTDFVPGIVFSCYSTTDLKPIPIPPTPSPPSPTPIPTPSPPSPTPPTPPSESSSSMGIIVGVAIGAVILFTFMSSKK
jgi:hypothetical protein